MKKNIHHLAFVIAVLLSGGLFGFFFTMSFSIMPGLDKTPHYSSLIANQMIGRATKESYFFVLLLGSISLLVVSLILAFLRRRKSCILWITVAISAWVGMLITTLVFNVPLNQTLDIAELTKGMANASELWNAYSVDWQNWNLVRVCFSGLSTLFAILGFKKLIESDVVTS